MLTREQRAWLDKHDGDEVSAALATIDEQAAEIEKLLAVAEAAKAIAALDGKDESFVSWENALVRLHAALAALGQPALDLEAEARKNFPEVMATLDRSQELIERLTAKYGLNQPAKSEPEKTCGECSHYTRKPQPEAKDDRRIYTKCSDGCGLVDSYGTKHGDGRPCDCKYFTDKRPSDEQTGCCEARVIIDTARAARASKGGQP